MNELWLAPMMGYTNGWFRSLIQALHPKVHVMSEMVTLDTLRHCPKHQSLWIHPLEYDPALQIAASSPRDVLLSLAQLQDLPFTHINLNAGCPSPNVACGSMGAALLKDPQNLCLILQALKASEKTISLKTRLGIDQQQDADWDRGFEVIMQADIHHIFLHARYAYLQGLNPQQNRSIPPLRYDRAGAVAAAYPNKAFILNGGLNSLALIHEYAKPPFSGVMLGRVAYQNPWIFWDLACLESCESEKKLLDWLEMASREPISRAMLPAILALTHGLPYAKALRDQVVRAKGKRFSIQHFWDMKKQQQYLAQNESYQKSEI